MNSVYASFIQVHAPFFLYIYLSSLCIWALCVARPYKKVNLINLCLVLGHHHVYDLRAVPSPSTWPLTHGERSISFLITKITSRLELGLALLLQLQWIVENKNGQVDHVEEDKIYWRSCQQFLSFLFMSTWTIWCFRLFCILLFIEALILWEVLFSVHFSFW